MVVNGVKYEVVSGGCGEAILIFKGKEFLTRVPYEVGWEKTAIAAITAIQAIEKARLAKSIESFELAVA